MRGISYLWKGCKRKSSKSLRESRWLWLSGNRLLRIIEIEFLRERFTRRWKGTRKWFSKKEKLRRSTSLGNARLMNFSWISRSVLGLRRRDWKRKNLKNCRRTRLRISWRKRLSYIGLQIRTWVPHPWWYQPQMNYQFHSLSLLLRFQIIKGRRLILLNIMERVRRKQNLWVKSLLSTLFHQDNSMQALWSLILQWQQSQQLSLLSPLLIFRLSILHLNSQSLYCQLLQSKCRRLQQIASLSRR